MSRAPRPTLHHITGSPAGPGVGSNRSTWMLNIGTHRLPQSDNEYQILTESLRRCFERIFTSPTFYTDMFYLVERQARGLVQFTDDVWREEGYFRIEKCSSEDVVERGANTGRIDAHILIDVTHADTQIQIDYKNFANLLQAQFMIENEYFRQNQIYSDKAPYDEWLSWPNHGIPYVSFRAVGKMNINATRAYMLKQFNQEQPYRNAAGNLIRTEVDEQTREAFDRVKDNVYQQTRYTTPNLTPHLVHNQ